MDGNIAGFALVRDQTEAAGDSVPHAIAEFFILRRYRRKGVGRDAARQIFASMRPGRWVVTQTLGNGPAQGFWRSVIGDHTAGRFFEHRDERYNRMEFSTEACPAT